MDRVFSALGHQLLIYSLATLYNAHKDVKTMRREIGIFKSTAIFTDKLNTEHTQIMSAELQQYPNLLGLLNLQLAMMLPVN